MRAKGWSLRFRWQNPSRGRKRFRSGIGKRWATVGDLFRDRRLAGVIRRFPSGRLRAADGPVYENPTYPAYRARSIVFTATVMVSCKCGS